jgi:peptidoglycan/xylan/chitin deacetylase (PgdA/CDA1 family)
MGMSWPASERGLEAEQQRTPPRTRLRRLLRRRLPGGVYVLAYHAVVGQRAEPWEVAYRRVATSYENFAAGLHRLVRLAEPARLGELPALVAGGGAKEPRLVVTFDDGYADLVSGVGDVCAELGLAPTVFASASFAGGDVYYRVLVALIEQDGRTAEAAALLNERLATDVFTADNLASATKDWSRPHELVGPVREAWGKALPRAHLSFDELRALVAAGWSIGNHTRTHRPLAFVPADELDDEILGNERDLRAAGLDPLPWLAYPNGRARDVSESVRVWLEREERFHGIFGAGGVNVAPTRTEWRRIPVSDEEPRALEELLHRAAEVTARCR